MKIGQYAFWSYDKYPYFRGGKITAIHPAKKGEYCHGCVEIEDCGKGYWWPVKFCLNVKEGKILLTQIKVLEDWFSEDRNNLRDLFNYRLNDILTDLSVPKIHHIKKK